MVIFEILPIDKVFERSWAILVGDSVFFHARVMLFIPSFISTCKIYHHDIFYPSLKLWTTKTFRRLQTF